MLELLQRLAQALGAQLQQRPWTVAILILALNLAVKAPYIGSSSLFLDEAVAIHETQGSISETIEFSASDPTPPLYYLLLGQWGHLFGTSETAARFPSLIFSCLTAALIYLIGRRYLGGVTGFLAAFIFTFNNAGINFAQEARAYALAGVLMSASYACFLALGRTQDRRWLPALGLLLLNTALLYTHYATAMGIAAQAILSLGWLRRERKNFLHYAGSQLLVLAAWMPWFLLNRSRIPKSKVTSWLEAPGLSLLKTVTTGITGHSWIAVLAIATILVGLVLVLRRQMQRPSPEDSPLRVVVGWALLAPALQVAVSYAFMPMFELRYVLYALPGLCLLLAAMMVRLPWPWLRWLVAVAYMGLAFWRLDIAPEKSQDWRAASETLRNWENDQTGMVVNAYYQFAPLAYYYRPAAFKDFQHTMPLLGEEQIHLGADTSIVPLIDGQSITQVILVLSHNELVDPEGHLIKFMKRHYCLWETEKFTGIELMRFVAGPCAGTEFGWDYESDPYSNKPEQFTDRGDGTAGQRATFVGPGAPYAASYVQKAGDILEGQFSEVEIGFEGLRTGEAKPITVVFVMEHAGEAYNWNGIAVQDQLKQDEWTQAQVRVQIPEVRDPNDKVQVYFWSEQRANCKFDNLTLEFNR